MWAKTIREDNIWAIEKEIWTDSVWVLSTKIMDSMAIETNKVINKEAKVIYKEIRAINKETKAMATAAETKVIEALEIKVIEANKVINKALETKVMTEATTM